MVVYMELSTPPALVQVFMATPIFFLVGIAPDLGKYLMFLVVLAMLATIGAALGFLVG
jgi:hypothetical protein